MSGEPTLNKLEATLERLTGRAAAAETGAVSVNAGARSAALRGGLSREVVTSQLRATRFCLGSGTVQSFLQVLGVLFATGLNVGGRAEVRGNLVVREDVLVSGDVFADNLFASLDVCAGGDVLVNCLRTAPAGWRRVTFLLGTATSAGFLELRDMLAVIRVADPSSAAFLDIGLDQSLLTTDTVQFAGVFAADFDTETLIVSVSLRVGAALAPATGSQFFGPVNVGTAAAPSNLTVFGPVNVGTAATPSNLTVFGQFVVGDGLTPFDTVLFGPFRVGNVTSPSPSQFFGAVTVGQAGDPSATTLFGALTVGALAAPSPTVLLGPFTVGDPTALVETRMHGRVFLGHATGLGETFVVGPLFVTGETGLRGDLTVGTIPTSRTTTLHGNLRFNQFPGSLFEDAIFWGPVAVNGPASFLGTVGITGKLSVLGGLSVIAPPGFGISFIVPPAPFSISMIGVVNITGVHKIIGATTITGATLITGALTVTGLFTVQANTVLLGGTSGFGEWAWHQIDNTDIAKWTIDMEFRQPAVGPTSTFLCELDTLFTKSLTVVQTPPPAFRVEMPWSFGDNGTFELAATFQAGIFVTGGTIDATVDIVTTGQVRCGNGAATPALRADGTVEFNFGPVTSSTLVDVLAELRCGTAVVGVRALTVRGEAVFNQGPVSMNAATTVLAPFTCGVGVVGLTALNANGVVNFTVGPVNSTALVDVTAEVRCGTGVPGNRALTARGDALVEGDLDVDGVLNLTAGPVDVSGMLLGNWTLAAGGYALYTQSLDRTVVVMCNNLVNLVDDVKKNEAFSLFGAGTFPTVTTVGRAPPCFAAGSDQNGVFNTAFMRPLANGGMDGNGSDGNGNDLVTTLCFTTSYSTLI